MSSRVRLARETPVSVCQGILAIDPILVRPEDDIFSVLHRSVAQPATRLIGVVDPAGRLIGILPILRLAEAVVARVSPASLMTDIADVADVARFGHAVESRTARDAMLPPASIRGEATVDEAFRVMHQRHLSGLYVVDADGRPTGYLDLLELALRYAEALEAGDPAPGTGSNLDPGVDTDAPSA